MAKNRRTACQSLHVLLLLLLVLLHVLLHLILLLLHVEESACVCGRAGGGRVSRCDERVVLLLLLLVHLQLQRCHI